MEEMTIGTKVRVITDRTMSKTDYTITAIIPYKEAEDWCDHYIVRGEDGEELNIRQYDCVFPPKESEYEDCTIHEFLDDNGVWAEVYPYQHDMPVMVVDIHWGDWKHQHLWAENLMGFLGYKEIGNKVTDEDGSDCYSAEHYFLKTA